MQVVQAVLYECPTVLCSCAFSAAAIPLQSCVRQWAFPPMCSAYVQSAPHICPACVLPACASPCIILHTASLLTASSSAAAACGVDDDGGGDGDLDGDGVLSKYPFPYEPLVGSS